MRPIPTLLVIMRLVVSVFTDEDMTSEISKNLQRRAGLDFLNNFGGGNQTGGTFGGPDPTAGLTDPCGQIELSPDSWNKLQVDQYLANYPNIDRLTLAEFAAEIEGPNFFCGIGLACLAGQICSPVVGINWLILYAIQEWNNYINSLYSAVENSINVMREASAGIVSDFMPTEHVDKSLFGYGIATTVIGILGIFTAIAVPVFMPTELTISAIEGYETVIVPTTSAETIRQGYQDAEAARQAGEAARVASLQAAADSGTIRAWFFRTKVVVPPREAPFRMEPGLESAMQRNLGFNVQHPVTRTRKRSLLKRDLPLSVSSYNPAVHTEKRTFSKRDLPPSVFSYSRWAFMDTHLTALQNRLQGLVALTAKIGTTAPIGASNGLATVLQGGTFLTPNPTKSDLQQAARELAQITALSEFFKSIGMFVTIASDPCTSDGPDGAWSGDDKLSYCTPQGIMMNIIQANGDKVSNSVRNAKLLASKYGFTTQYLTQAALDCQSKYGISPLSVAPPPSSAKSDCVFTLPVCDCTLQDVQHMRHHGHGTVKACRDGAHLPI